MCQIENESISLQSLTTYFSSSWLIWFLIHISIRLNGMDFGLGRPLANVNFPYSRQAVTGCNEILTQDIIHFAVPVTLYHDQ